MGMTRRQLLLSASAALVGSLDASASADKQQRQGARTVPEICVNAIETRQAVGIAVHLQRGSTVLLSAGYGHANLETDTAVTPVSVFRIGSVSKQFLAASILLLADARELSLEDSMAKYLPDFPRSREVSLRMLLNHTSGIQNISRGILPSNDYSTAEIVEVIRSQQPLYGFEPGTRWSYSNTAYWLAGAILERITGRAYWDFYQERLFRPA